MDYPIPLVRWFAVVALSASWLVLSGCRAENPPPQNAGATSVLRLATTTSTRDSGLLDVLLPVFETRYDCRVDVVAVGTGAALKLGEAGDADVLLVHAPGAEEDFMKAGHGSRREAFMENFLMILGPPDDPAGVGSDPPIDALGKIAVGNHRFISRGDDSGTHKRELALWNEAGGRPQWSDYIESGSGMGATLIMADEMRGYVLADQGTYLKFKDKIDLIPLGAAAENLRNAYSLITVSPDKHRAINGKSAEALVEFLLAAESQQRIMDYQVGGHHLFRPTRIAGQN